MWVLCIARLVGGLALTLPHAALSASYSNRSTRRDSVRGIDLNVRSMAERVSRRRRLPPIPLPRSPRQHRGDAGGQVRDAAVDARPTSPDRERDGCLAGPASSHQARGWRGHRISCLRRRAALLVLGPALLPLHTHTRARSHTHGARWRHCDVTPPRSGRRRILVAL